MVEAASDATWAQWGVVLGASLVAAVIDLKTRRIPNALTLPMAVVGLLYAFLHEGLVGLGDAFVACVLVALPYVLLFVFAGGGAGDAKMMGAVGAWLGIEAGVVVLFAVAATGILFGLLNLATHGQVGAGFRRIGAAFYVMTVALCSGRKGWALLKPDLEQEAKAPDRRLTIPYGPAIFIGVSIGALVIHLWNG